MPSRSCARPYSSMPAWSLGLLVVHRLTWQNAWKVHLCTLVAGHSAAAADAKPDPPSVTTTSGGATVLSRALHASVLSERARYQDRTCSSVHAISTQRPRSRCMPSTKTTRCTSSTTSGIGHIGQNLAAALRKLRPWPAMSSWLPLPRSHDRKALSSRAAVSLPCVELAPHDLHRQRCLPALVLPFLFIGCPQDGRFFSFIRTSAKKRLFTGFIVHDLVKQ